MEELDHTPDTSFERDVVCEDEDAFCLSLENIATLKKLLRQVMSTQTMAWEPHSIQQFGKGTVFLLILNKEPV